MPSYESLASTRMLATHCAVCHRDLRDAVSVETGMGPECREKYGCHLDVAPEARAEANELIYLIADKRKGPSVEQAASRLRELGLTVLAEKLLRGMVKIRLERHGDTLRLFTPYDPTDVERLKRIPGRWFKDGANEYPYSSRNAVWAALRELYPGQRMLGPDWKIMEIKPLPGQESRPGDGFGDVSY